MEVRRSFPLKVALLGVNERDNAILDLFLRKQCPGGCRLVKEEQADLCILNLDGVHGRKLLQYQRDHHPQRPLIVLTVREAIIDGVQCLRKPLRAELLKQAIESARADLAVQPPVEQHPVQSPAQPPVQAIVPEIQPSPENSDRVKPASVGFAGSDRQNPLRNLENQTRITHECCGLAKAIDLSKEEDREKIYYDPTQLMQHLLKNAIDRCRREGRPFRLLLAGGKHITLLPKANVALSDLPDAKLRPRCLLPIKPKETRLEYPLNDEEYLLSMSQVTPQNMDALLWKVSLWSARGRLPVGVDVHSTIGLIHWPNLTRFLVIPQFFRVAALWVKKPHTLTRTAESLGIEARYVCAFFSACHALELTLVQGVAADFEVPVVSEPKPSLSGILGRILRRLHVA
jgi:hypothetical protein